jgi:hypothetical protein
MFGPFVPIRRRNGIRPQGWPRPFRLIGRPAGRASAALDAMRFRPPRLIAMVLADTGHVMPCWFFEGRLFVGA